MDWVLLADLDFDTRSTEILRRVDNAFSTTCMITHIAEQIDSSVLSHILTYELQGRETNHQPAGWKMTGIFPEPLGVGIILNTYSIV